MGIDPREKVSGDWWSQPWSEFGSKVKLLDHHMTCIHVAGCWKVDWIGWGEGAPEATGTGHAQHSKEATIACGLQRFQGLLVPFRSWGSPATVLAGQFQRSSFLFLETLELWILSCLMSSKKIVLVSFWFKVVFPLQCSQDAIFGSVSDHYIPDVVQQMQIVQVRYWISFILISDYRKILVVYYKAQEKSMTDQRRNEIQ